MKSVFVLLFTLLCTFNLALSAVGSYDQPVPVYTYPTTYNFSSSNVITGDVLGPILTISSSQALSSSVVTVSRLNTPPTVTANFSGSPVSYSLPAGYSVISGAQQAGFGFNLSSDLSDSSALSGVFTIPAYNGYSNLSAQGRQLGLLYFDRQSQVYSAVPVADYNVSSTGAITNRVLRSTQLVIVSRIIGAIPLKVSASSPDDFYVLGNTPQSFSVSEAGVNAFTIDNLTSQAGGLSVGVSNAVNQLSSISNQNLTLVSSIYSFNHSAGVNAISSASLVYNLALSSAANFSSTAARWYRFNPQSNTFAPVTTGTPTNSNSVVSQNIASLSGYYAILSTPSNIPLSSYNASLPVTNAASVYSFGRAAGLGPVLTVSSPQALSTSNVAITPINTLPVIQVPSGNSFRTFSLPSSFSSLTSLTGQQGFNVLFSNDLNANPSLASTLTLPAIPNYSSLLSSGSVVVPLAYNTSSPNTASTYSALPSSQYTVFNNGSVQIILSRSLSFILASYNPMTSIVSLSDSVAASFLLAANYPQTVSVSNPSGLISLVLNNITAQAGSLSVQISNNALNANNIARQAGRTILSNVYNITHSAGPSSSFVAQITYYLNSVNTNTTSNSVAPDTAQWYRYNSGSGSFDRLGGAFSSDVNGRTILTTALSSLPSSSDLSVQASSIVSAVYAQAVRVSSTPTAYRFGPTTTPAAALPVLVVSAPQAGPSSSISVSQISALPRVPVTLGSITSTFSLPSGYVPLSAGALQQGFAFNFSSDLSAVPVNAVFQIPAAAISIVNNYANQFSALAYNPINQTFTALAANQYNVAVDGSVNVTVTQVNSYILFAVRNFSANVADLSNGIGSYFLIAANSSQSFVVTQGNQAAVVINNLAAEAGTLFVGLSDNVEAQRNAANNAGNVIVSNIYRFNHSLGSQAVHSASLQFNLNQSVVTGVDASSVSWYRFNTGANVWEERPSSVSGSGSNQVVVTVTNSFSDWSAQSKNASPSSGAASALQAPTLFKAIAQLLF